MKILPLFVLILMWFAHVSAQDVSELSTLQKMNFPNGYDIVDGQGKIVKKMPNERSANVKAYADFEGVRHYMSDWSYQRHRDNGIKPNWIRGRAGEANKRVDDRGKVSGLGQRTAVEKIDADSLARSIESLINGGNYSGVKVLAERYLAHSTLVADEMMQAEAHYYLGLSFFLAGNDDAKAQRFLEKSTAMYSRLSPKDYTGEWKALYVTTKLYFDYRVKLPNVWVTMGKNLDVLEQAVRREQLGLGLKATGQEMYKVIVSDPELLHLDREMTELTKNLRKASVSNKELNAKLLKEDEDYLSDLYRSIEGRGFGQNMNLARAKYYKLGIENVSSRESTFKLVRDSFSERLSVLRKVQRQMPSIDGNVDIKSAVVGFDREGQRWAYEFLSIPSDGKVSLREAQGDLMFGGSNWVIYANEQNGNVGQLQTDIFFFNAKTLQLEAHLRVPNTLIYVGKMPESGIFYFLTITPSKYKYDDTSLALTLADPVTSRLERVWLLKNAGNRSDEDYWFAPQNSISLSASGKVLYLDVLRQSLAGYKVHRNNPVFGDVSIKLRAGSSIKNRQLRADTKHENTTWMVRNLEKDEAGLDHLGAKFDTKAIAAGSGGNWCSGNWGASNSGESTGLAVVGTGTGELRLLRSSSEGSILDISLGTLLSSSTKLGNVRPQKPGLFKNGNLRCVIDESVVLKTKKGLEKIPYSKKVDDVSFSGSKVYITKRYDTKSSSWSKVFNFDGQPMSLNQKLNSEFRAKFPEGGHSLGFKIEAENNAAFSSFGSDGSNVFVRYDLRSGKQVGEEIITSTGKFGGYPGCVQSGHAPVGYDVCGVITERTTLGPGFSILLRNQQTGKSKYLEGGLPSLPNPLVVKENEDQSFRVFYSLPGLATLANYKAEALVGPLKHSFGKPVLEGTIQQWKYPPGQGRVLYDEKHNWVFIPSVSGYLVFDIGGQGKPQKKFDIHFEGADEFTIVLPNGNFAGSAGCENLIRLSKGSANLDANTLSPWRNRPADVLRALGGDLEQIDVLEKVTERWLRKLGHPERSPEPSAEDVASLALTNDVPLWAEGEDVNIVLQVKAGTAPVNDVVVRVNGVDQQRGSNSIDGQAVVKRTVKLAGGQNWIEAVAIDEKGRSSNLVRFRTILRKSLLPSRRFIVAMGVSKYSDPSLNLDFAAKDAQDLAEALKSISPEGSTTLVLTDEKVTKGALVQVREFLSKATENDEVIALCAGHGTLDRNLDYLFCGHNFDKNRPTENGIKLDELVEAIGSCKSMKRLLLLDTCHSGQVGEKDELLLAQMGSTLPEGVRAVKQRGMTVKQVSGLGAEGQQRFIEDMFLLPGLHRGINIIGASGGAEFARESTEWNNGVFTSAIIEALRDKKADLNDDKRIKVGELRNYLAQRVPELTGGAQKPSVVAYERDQDFTLLMKDGDKAVSFTTKPLVSPSPEGSSVDSQVLQALDAPQKVDFPNGYDVIDGRGKLLKELPDSRSANVHAYRDISGVRQYVSDWSYQRYRDQGIEPNWLRARVAGAQPRPVGSQGQRTGVATVRLTYPNGPAGYVKGGRGALIWNNIPKSNESALWSGGVSEGYAQGHGKLTWYKNGRAQVSYEGGMMKGKFEGRTICTASDGRKQIKFWKNGKKLN